jgi:hypothetical protein
MDKERDFEEGDETSPSITGFCWTGLALSDAFFKGERDDICEELDREMEWSSDPEDEDDDDDDDDDEGREGVRSGLGDRSIRLRRMTNN